MALLLSCTYVTKFSTNSLYVTKLYVTYIELCKSVICHIQQQNPPETFLTVQMDDGDPHLHF